MIFNVAKIRHFAIEKISNHVVNQGNFFGKFTKNKIVKNFVGFGQMSSFLLLKSPYFS